MKIAFTGHRDAVCKEDDLQKIVDQYPDATWWHGGATGFDQFVERFAQTHGVKTEVLLPDYRRHGRGAPLRRNQTIVDGAIVLVALYDGRNTGGTKYTVNYAAKVGVPVQILALA